MFIEASSVVVVFNSSELPSALTCFLDPNDLNQLSQVSKKFHSLAEKQFKLFTQSNSKLIRNDLHIHKLLFKPSVFFHGFPIVREKFVTFDKKGKKYFKELISQNLGGYQYISEIPPNLSIKDIYETINHLKVQFEHPLINPLRLFKGKKLALEAKRKSEEIIGINEYQAWALAYRLDLSRQDVLGISDCQVCVLSTRKDLNRGDVQGLTNMQAMALVKRKDLNQLDVAGLTNKQINILIKRKKFIRADVEGLKDALADVLAVRLDFNRSDVNKLQYSYQIKAVIERKDLSIADVKELTYTQVETLIERKDLKRIDVEGLRYMQADVLRFRMNLTRKDVEKLSDEHAGVLTLRGEITLNEVLKLTRKQALKLISNTSLPIDDVKKCQCVIM